MGIIKLLSGLFDAFNAVMTMMREKELRQQGFNKALGDIREKRLKNAEKVKEIDDKPVPDDPDDILGRL